MYLENIEKNNLKGNILILVFGYVSDSFSNPKPKKSIDFLSKFEKYEGFTKDGSAVFKSVSI